MEKQVKYLKIKIPNWLNKPTIFSKMLAIILLIGLPIAGFFIGYNYKEKIATKNNEKKVIECEFEGSDPEAMNNYPNKYIVNPGDNLKSIANNELDNKFTINEIKYFNLNNNEIQTATPGAILTERLSINLPPKEASIYSNIIIRSGVIFLDDPLVKQEYGWGIKWRFETATLRGFQRSFIEDQIESGEIKDGDCVTVIYQSFDGNIKPISVFKQN